MIKINKNLLNVQQVDNFEEVSKRVNEYKINNPNNKLLNLGVGDVSKPIIKEVIDEMNKAINELGNIDTFKGYGYFYGHSFLKKKIIDEYKCFTEEEIYISDGAKTDTTNILELFDKDSLACLFNPSYPVYRDALDIMGIKYEYIDANEFNDFRPLPNKKYDIVYICSPSNPLGIAYDKDYLTKWVKYALKNNCIILYDNVYDSFIRSSNVPKTIYEIEGSKKIAIEFRSYSKKASFTGVRCSYYIIPNELIIKDVNKYWKKRVMTKFNGSDYIAQRGALATYSDKSIIKINKNIDDYLTNARYIKEELEKLNYKVYGGFDSPYLWIKNKNNMSSWNFFDLFLNELNIIVIPGIVFGTNGDNYFRVSALAKKSVIYEAIERIKSYEKEN